MKILLINDNPVVSRLLAMCTRNDGMVLEEVIDVNSIQGDIYDIVFIDDRLYKEEVLNVLGMIDIGRKVLFTTSDMKINDFDTIMKKPFLPSQIIELLEESTQHIEEIKVQVLDLAELEKIKALLDMDEVENESLSDEEIEQRKIEVIKEQLIADGLEIVGEEDIIEELRVKDEIVVFSSNESIKKKKKKKASKNKDKKSKKKKKKSIAFIEEELERIEDAVQVAIAALKRKQMKKLLKGKEVEVVIKLEDDI